MKNLLSAILLVSIIACQPTATEQQPEGEPTFEIIDTSPSIYAVSLADAVENVNFYDKVVKKELGIDPIRAFTIRSVDLAESIGLPTKYLRHAEYRHIRIYMGLDSLSADSAAFKIYLTPVKGAKLSAGIPGTDVILTGPYSGSRKEAESEDGLGDGNGPHVFDFSQPCPNACDDNSPLND